MSPSLWAQEVARYMTIENNERERWLARLLFALTVLARGAYTVGQEGLDDPVRMRRFNELMHRTASQLRTQMERSSGRPDELFFKIVEGEIAALGIPVSDLIETLRS